MASPGTQIAKIILEKKKKVGEGPHSDFETHPKLQESKQCGTGMKTDA